MGFLHRRTERTVAPARKRPTVFAKEALENVEVVENGTPRLLVRRPLAVEVRQPHKEGHTNGDQVVRRSEGFSWAEAERTILERTRGRRRVPHETQGKPKCQIRTTRRNTIDTSKRKSSIEQMS